MAVQERVPRCFFRTALTGDVLHLEGELDVAGVPALEDALADAETALGGDPLTVSLCDLEFIDGAGLGVLVSAAERAQRDGPRLAITPGRGAAGRLLVLCGLDLVLPLSPVVEEAQPATA